MTSPDMIWRMCGDCDRQFTLADVDDLGECPHCGSSYPDHLSDGGQG